jgi:GT2 family glycosyltransferase
MSVPRVAVSIVTRNRAPVLERTLRELEKLTPLPDEICIYADACTDDTKEMITRTFPRVRLLSDDVPRGSIHGRDRILREVQSEIVLSLDDDSYPIETDFISRLQTLHAAHPSAAVCTFPQVSEEYPETLRDPAPWKNAAPSLVASFTDSGASLWRAAYLELPGFVPEFVHAYEEPDYTLQCLAAGWQVRHEPSLTVRHHYTSVNRDPLRTHLFHCRNEVWSVLLRAPLLLLPVMIVFRVLRQFGNAARLGGWRWVKHQPRWWWQALGGAGAMLRKRHAVPWGSYWNWLRLSRKPRPL